MIFAQVAAVADPLSGVSVIRRSVARGARGQRRRKWGRRGTEICRELVHVLYLRIMLELALLSPPTELLLHQIPSVFKTFPYRALSKLPTSFFYA